MNSNMERTLKELESCLIDLNKTEMGRRSLLTALPFLLAACATGEKTRYREGDNTGQAASLTPAAELQLTREALPKMRKQYPRLNNQKMQRYISNLGQGVIHRNQLHKNPYQYNFTVVDVPYINAFALPAGTVFVTAPLIAAAKTEAELVGVIGHEVGHIQARHTAERMYKAEKSKKSGLLMGAGGGLLGAALGYGAGTLLCRKNDRKCLAKATQLGAAAGFSGGLLIQKFGFMANSREDEMEADRIGFRTSVRTGYHKDYVGNFYETLLKMEQASGKGKNNQNKFLASFADAMSTHPPSQERVNQMKEMAREQKGGQNKISSKEFEEMSKLAKQYTARAQAKAKKSQG